VVNHYTDQRYRSWAGVAEEMLTDADRKSTPEERAAEKSWERSETEQEARHVPAPAPTPSIRVVPAPAGRALEFSYLYATRVPTVPLTDRTAVEATLTERILGATEGLCESGAALECSLENPNMAIYRVLPESMLPGQEPTRMFQCLPCYEASAEAYVRKLHHINGAS
jgi:hypothetical protein